MPFKHECPGSNHPTVLLADLKQVLQSKEACQTLENERTCSAIGHFVLRPASLHVISTSQSAEQTVFFCLTHQSYLEREPLRHAYRIQQWSRGTWIWSFVVYPILRAWIQWRFESAGPQPLRPSINSPVAKQRSYPWLQAVSNVTW